VIGADISWSTTIPSETEIERTTKKVLHKDGQSPERMPDTGGRNLGRRAVRKTSSSSKKKLRYGKREKHMPAKVKNRENKLRKRTGVGSLK